MVGSGDRISKKLPSSVDNSPAKPRTGGNPRNYSATHVLRNGTAILIRAVRSGDKVLFRTAFHNSGSRFGLHALHGLQKGLDGS